MKFVNEGINTFHSYSSPVKIYDDKKNIFYFHPNKKQNINFNLPKGKYFYDCIIRGTFRKNYPLLELPEREHFFDFRNFKVRKLDNPHKATIFPERKEIILDKQIAKTKFKPALVFILAHEKYHCLYKTEEFCDMGATNFMLQQGYNPSQIATAYKILFRRNHSRNDFLDKTFNEKNFIL